MSVWSMFGIERETVDAMRPRVRSPFRFGNYGPLSGWNREAVDEGMDRLFAKAERRFYKAAERIPEDLSSPGALIGRRYEVRVVDVGGRGLAQIDQKQRTVLVTKSAAEAKRKADETGGSVWDRKIAYLIYEGGAEPVARVKREKRDGGTWGWLGSSTPDDEAADE